MHIYCIFSLERNTNIHPDNRQDVEFLRERAQQAMQADATTETPTTRVGRPRHDTCPICLTDSSVLSVETNCGHLFCGSFIHFITIVFDILVTIGKCIITFWKFQANWMSGMNCPVCRQPVSVIDFVKLSWYEYCFYLLGNCPSDMFY